MTELKTTPGTGTEPSKTKSGGQPTKDTNVNAWAGGKPRSQGTTKDYTKKDSSIKKEKFEGDTKGLEGHTFYFGKGMDIKFLASKEKLLNYICTKYSASEQVSIQNNKVTLLGKSHPPKHKEADFKALVFWEQEQWKIDMKRYTDLTDTLHKNLTACYGIIWGQMTLGLQNQIKREKKYKTVEAERNAPGLYALLTLVCQRTTTNEQFATSMIDTLYAITELSGDKMSLGEYYNHFCAKRKVANASGFEIGNSPFENNLDVAIMKRNNWGPSDPAHMTWRIGLKAHANEVCFAMIFLKQAGYRYDECRRSIKNDYAKGIDSAPYTVDEAYALLQKFESTPRYNPKAYNKKGVGDDENSNPNSKGKFPGHSFQQNARNFR